MKKVNKTKSKINMKARVASYRELVEHDFRLYQKYTKFKCPLVQDKFVNHPAGVADF